ncbi:5691_t:CDS:2, partial [Rhizophagus irregularis]
MSNNHIPTILIIGAGLGGLLLYHGIQKHLNKNVKKFNVVIFERDIGPQDRWQGYNIGINSYGMMSLISCLPETLVTRLPEVIPNPIHEKEYPGVLHCDHKGTELFRTPPTHFKSLFELTSIRSLSLISYRNRLRDLMLEGVNIQWGKKCIGYDEFDDE